jgi:CRISPR-associated protein Cmr3
MNCLTITPRDPVIARDGRPFSASQRRVRSLDWPYPGVLAGSLRTLLGKLADSDFGESECDALRAVAVAGPLPSYGGELYFPAPDDAVIEEVEETRERIVHAARPGQVEGGCNLPHRALSPVVLPEDVEDFKPAQQAAFWSRSRMAEWLLEEKLAFPPPPPPAPEEAKSGDGYLAAPAQEERTHVCIEESASAAKESLLFQTTGLDFAEGVTIAARVEAAGERFESLLDGLDCLHPLGGERRLAHWQATAREPWQAPEAIVNGLEHARSVRMVLATPAIFANGWRPGWVGEDLTCSLLGGAVKMKLTGVAIRRWRPVSGWRLEHSAKWRRGPKAVQRATPAGGVYFFQVISGDAADLAKRLWLASVSDLNQNQSDGFGLALWGKCSA